jgi:dihydrofolate reductase
MKISMIVAYGKNWEIGLNNEMLWHISEDFKNFKTITSGHHIYETLFSYVDKLYLSEVDFEGVADAFLKPIDFSTWDLAEEKSYEEILEHGKIKSPAWKFKVWVKKD